MAIYIFAYGSLMSPISAGQTLKRKILPSELMPARLHGFKKAWSAHGGTQCFLNIELRRTIDTWGVLIKLNDEKELKLLDRRELLYARIDVSRHINTDLDEKYRNFITAGDTIYTYTVTNKNILKDTKPVFFDYYCLCYTSALIYGITFYHKWRGDLPKLTFT